MKHTVVIQVYKIDNGFFFVFFFSPLQKVQYLKQKAVIVGCFRCPQLFGMWKDVCYKCFTPVIAMTSEWFNYSCFEGKVHEEMISGGTL